jgi:Kef-type K+ transport system membrane component KefB
VTEHQLFLLLAESALLVLAARVGGEIAIRLGVAQVVGELAMGILLGPSLFGAVWPGGFRALFPPDLTQRNVLEMIGWIGVIFLVLVSGMEVELGVLRSSSRVVVWGWIGGFLLPFTLGIGLGLATPSSLIPVGIQRSVFAVFLGTAMSISAIPVIARILMDMKLIGTRVGTIILSSAVADDTIGWVVLAVITSIVLRHRVDVPTVAVALLGTLAFVILAFTLGQRLVAMALRGAERVRVPYAKTTAAMLILFAFGAITQAIHVHLVLGCFVAGILISRVHWDRQTIEPLRTVGMAFFTPFFFAYTGLKVDLTTLKGSAAWVAAAAVVVACVGKFVGAGLGARFGGLPRWEALAVGAGLNARGAMELVIAAVGLSIGVLSLAMYSAIVLMAVVTTLMAAPILRACLRRASAEELVTL